MYVVDSPSRAVPFTITEGCALKGTLLACAASHTPFLGTVNVIPSALRGFLPYM